MDIPCLAGLAHSNGLLLVSLENHIHRLLMASVGGPRLLQKMCKCARPKKCLSLHGGYMSSRGLNLCLIWWTGMTAIVIVAVIFLFIIGYLIYGALW